MKFRKKPVVIEAVQFDGSLASVECLVGLTVTQDRTSDSCQIETLEGVMSASKGDWIICGIKGEFYPCKPDIFAATYEPEMATAADVAALVADLTAHMR